MYEAFANKDDKVGRLRRGGGKGPFSNMATNCGRQV